MKEKILVIGANGQLGSALTQGLWQRYGAANVLATDIKKPRKGVLEDGHFETLDAMDKQALNALMQANGFTQVYHLAAILSAKGEQNPELAWHLNMTSLLSVLDAAVKFGVEKVYWPSSIAVFGPTTPKDRAPQDTITAPTTVYGISKLAGERWCAWYHRQHGLDVRSLRYPGLIGYASPPGGGTTDYAVDIYFKAVEAHRYTSFLKADTALPMMYMADAVKATLDLMDADARQLTVRSAYNIAAMSITPDDIAASIRKHLPDFEILYQPDQRQQIADSWPRSIDDTVARRDWHWAPAFGLDEMTADMLQHLKAILVQK